MELPQMPAIATPTQPAKRAPGRKRGRRRPRRAPQHQVTWLVVVVIAALAAGWAAHLATEGRMWDEFRQAGHRAYGRGNYKYARQMYREALQRAEERDPGGSRVVASLLDMGRVHQAQGHPDTAAVFQARARALQASSGK